MENVNSFKKEEEKMNIEKLLDDAIESEFEELKSVDKSTEEYKERIDALAKLMDRSIEINKIHEENDMKVDNFEEDRRDRKIKNGIAIAGLVTSTLVTVIGTYATFRFDEKGTITSSLGRQFVNRLLPKK